MSGMTTSISHGAVTARESARHGDGKFGEQQHTGDDITLGFAGSTAEALPDIEREVPISWYTMELPSKRHRKPVPVKHEGTATVGIPHYSADQAPEVMSVRKRIWRGDEGSYVQEFRNIDGHLYTQHNGDEPVGSIDDAFASLRHYDYNVGRQGYDVDRYGVGRAPDSEWDVQQRMMNGLSSYVVIDGELWTSVTEPVYKVESGGWGGTPYLTVTGAPADTDSTAPDNYFPADQYDEALAYVETYAAQREGGYRGIDEDSRIVVADNFTPGSTWSPAPRLTYPEPEWDMKGEKLQSAFTQFRTALANVPGGISGDADGRKRIDWSKYTDEQQRHYKEFVTKSLEDGVLL
jgi:hypothetical protein